MYKHQGPPAIDLNLTAEDIARLRFPVAFFSKNAYNI